MRAQALIFLSTPFISIPEVLLMRQMDFRRQALVNLVATLVSAGVALGCALGGLGVWTLVWAPIALFWTRALGLQLVTRSWHWPSFRFAGAGSMFSFGMALLASTFGWTVINQADTLIAARKLTPHDLGLYAEALFLTTLIATKFVPPLNEVAYPAYARMQEDRALLAASFLKAVRLIMLVTCPLYLGLSVAAPDFVAVVLGAKWQAMAPLMTILAFAMPAQTLHILFAPAINALGHVRVTMRSSLLGALVMPPAYLIGSALGRDGARLCLAARIPGAAAVHLPAGARKARHHRQAAGGGGRARPAGERGDGSGGARARSRPCRCRAVAAAGARNRLRCRLLCRPAAGVLAGNVDASWSGWFGAARPRAPSRLRNGVCRLKRARVYSPGRSHLSGGHGEAQ